MGIFEWLKTPKTNVEVLEDAIWLTTQAKFAGISAAAARFLADPARPLAVLLVAHFRDCLESLQAVVEQGGSDPSSVIVAAADSLQGRAVPTLGADDSQTLVILVAERHPLSSHDAAIVNFAKGLPCRCRLAHHVSLEDPLLRTFAGEWLQGVLQRLGMQEGDAIESRMVGRRIQQALQKIEDQAVSDLPADSAAQWLQQNCPDLWRDIQP